MKFPNPIAYLERKMISNIVRHFAAAAAAYAAAQAAKHGLTLDPVELTAAMLAVYAAAEKLLKKPFGHA